MRIQFKTGEIVEFPPGTNPKDAVEAFTRHKMKEAGVEDLAPLGDRVKEGVRRQMSEWIEKNPITARTAAYQSGARDIGRNVANMIQDGAEGLGIGQSGSTRVTDEDITSARERDAPLEDELGGYHLAGSIIPTLAAPVGGGAGATATGAKAGWSALRAALARQAGTGMARAGAEGALFGAASAGPENRAAGAAMGAAGGAVANRLAASLTRLGTGLVPPAARAAETAGEVGKATGREAFLPISMGAPHTGTGSMGRWVYDKALRILPTANVRVREQEGDLVMQGYEAMLMKAMPGKAREVALKKFNETGNLMDAMIAGKAVLPPGVRMGRAGKVLWSAARSAKDGLPTFANISRAASNRYGELGSKAPLKQLADDMADLTNRGGKDPGLVERIGAYAAFRGGPGGVAGTSLIGRGMASEGAQKVLSGSTVPQRTLRKASDILRGTGASQLGGRAAREAAIDMTNDEVSRDYAEIMREYELLRGELQ